MTTPEIKRRIAEIKRCRRDDEKAHVLQDALYQDFIKSVAGAEHSLEMLSEQANMVLSTNALKFERWCA